MKEKNGINKEAFKFLHLVNVGVLIVDKEDKKVNFCNNYFKKEFFKYNDIIFSNIFDVLSSGQYLFSNLEIRISDELLINCSVYSISNITESKYLVIINNANMKNICMEVKKNIESFKSLSLFASDIAHEAGNPITSTILILQVMLKKMESWDIEKKIKYINISISELKKLSTFLGSIRSNNDNIEVENLNVELKPIVKMAKLQSDSKLMEKRVYIDERIDENLKIFVDPDAIFVVILNIIRNSILCTGKNKTIKIEAKKISEFFIELVFHIDDLSIEEKIIKKFFLPVITSNEEEKVSLEYALKLMTKMGGTIRIQSDPSENSIDFSLYIPTVKAEWCY